MTREQRARHLLDQNDHMTIATADASGVPWVSPVFYVLDGYSMLYWVSDRSARHSINIRANSAVAIVIFETDPVDAIYLSARAIELSEVPDIDHAMHVLKRKAQPDQWVVRQVADVIGDSPWRIYRAAVDRVEVRAETTKFGKAVVVRELADVLWGASSDSPTGRKELNADLCMPFRFRLHDRLMRGRL
jgi:nitroimidazol reductase NimA-like FMN-containing flavoprotein (pyridoxamine 5'-phosphate oxidase superfamily)